MSEYVGLDVSKEETAFCVKDADGTILARGKTATDPQALFEVLKEHCLCPGRIVMETGTLSGWLARELAKLGITVDVIDARQAHAVMRLQHNKTDANDAELLAEIARTGFCRPVTVKSETAQERRVLLKARAHLVGVRRDTENTVRGLLASLGLRFPKGSAKLVMRVREALEDHPELVATIEPLLSAVAALKRESERLDAAVLARAKGDPACRLLMTVTVKSETAQERRVLLKARAHLVGVRRDTENTVRGLLASLGLRFPKGSAKLVMRVREALEDHPELVATIEPLLSAVAALKRESERLDAAVLARAKGDPACRLLMTVPGVGPVTALAYAATVGDAERFAKSRAVGAYVGLTSRRWQSGEMDYSGRISKHGDAMLRSLLYEAANSLLTVVRRAHPLKDWARRIRKRTSHKKACVALARKLAVILHRMLITGEAFRWPEKEAATTA